MDTLAPTAVHALAGLVAGQTDVPAVLRRALDSLGALVPYDLAAVFRRDGPTLRVIASAGRLASAATDAHRLALDRFPTLQRALELRRPLALEAHHHASDEGDPWDGVLDLPHGHSCMVVPLFAGERSLGLITLDGRSCAVYPPATVELAGVVGQLVSLAFVMAEQAAALDRARLQLQDHNRLLTEEVGGADIACQRLLASRAPAMVELARLARQVAPTPLPVLLLGPTGAGKEVAAQAIHAWSARADAPFVKLNCAAIPENLVESELFGHRRGAFSGADRERRGRFQTAHGGTLLLDEVGDLPLSAQGKLLRVLQEGTFEPVGSDTPVRVDVRVLAATHVDLLRAVREGRFREDLYFRLAVFPLRVPALAERAEDVVPLALDWLDAEARRSRRGPWSLPAEARAALEAAPWPGNVRELVNALQRATVLVPAGPLSPAALGLADAPAVAPPPRPPAPAPVAEDAPLLTWEEAERAYFRRLLAASGGKLYGPDGAAARAALPPTTLRARLVKLGLR